MEARRYEADERLRDGGRLHVRAIKPDDKASLVELFERLSPETIYYRFLGAKTRLSVDELVYLTELDFDRQVALVASLSDLGGQRIVGVGRYSCIPNGPDDRAEIAITIEDAWQGRGIGTLLLKHLICVARNEGIAELEANLLSDNTRMIRLLERSGLVLSRSARAGLCHLRVSTAATHSSFPSNH